MADSSPSPLAILWFRQDLRLGDHPALMAAIRHGNVIPLFILDEESDDMRTLGGASRWWLHYALKSLDDDLQKQGSKLILRRGKAQNILQDLIKDTNANAIFWHRLYEPYHRARDEKIKSYFQEEGITVKSFNGTLLNEPWDVKNKSGGVFKVFSPYWKTVQRDHAPKDTPLSRPTKIPAPAQWPKSDRLEEWQLPPKKPDWAGGMRVLWCEDGQTISEEGAMKRLKDFFEDGLKGYKDNRNFPALGEHTSKLSPFLHWGQITPKQIWFATYNDPLAQDAAARDRDHFLSEICWREFSYYLLYHWPDLPQKNWKENFDHFPWAENKDALRQWQKGQTGYPIIDAGMRELWQTGWMHNRVRMIVASFLIKDLLINWQEGEKWFWDTLVDADLANNVASWQWVAGSGADASPYFRIFNPILQSKKFDPDAAYLKHWLPELRDLDPQYCHAPWEAPEETLVKAGIRLGQTYPHPMVDHGKARDFALESYKKISKSAD